MVIPLESRKICVNSALFYDHHFREGLFILMNGLIFTARITDINRGGLGFSGEKQEQKKEEKEKNHHQNPSRAKGKRFHWTKPPKQDYSPISCMKLINKDIFKKPNMPKVIFVQQIIRERRASSAWRSKMMPRQGHPNLAMDYIPPYTSGKTTNPRLHSTFTPPGPPQ